MRFFNLNLNEKLIRTTSYLGPYVKKVSDVIYRRRTFLSLLFVAFLLSDLVLLQISQMLLPGETLPPSSSSLSRQNVKNKKGSDYSVIWEKNLFHEGPLLDKRIGTASLYQQEPEKSSLPFDLAGTIVHANPRRSVSTIKVNNESQSYQVGDMIDGKAELSRIERRRVVFFNKDTSLLEYIEIPEIDALKITQASPRSQNNSTHLIKQVSSNQFSVKRSDINSYLKNLPEILRQARMIPNRVKRNGEFAIEGFRFASIKKGSIFEKLGFQLGDTIKQVNGEDVNAPEKALELFEKLRSSSKVKLLVEKDGKDVEYEYNVSENAPIGN